MPLGFLALVIPNAFKLQVLIILSVLSFYYLLVKGTGISSRLLLIWLAVVGVTILYVLVGIHNGAPDEAANQVAVIYVISPLLWIISLRGALLSFGLAVIVKAMLFYTFLAISSQGFYYWAISAEKFPFLLDLMSGTPNLDYSNNRVAAVMFVFGAMTFLFAGIFAAPDVIRSKTIRLLAIVACVISAITSGRSAVILSLGIGWMIFILAMMRTSTSIHYRFLANVVFGLTSTVVASWALTSLYQIDAKLAVMDLIDKVTSGGGEGRKDYLPQLLGGAADDFFLGAGHGIGVEFIASGDFPWRYEVVGAATLYRVGIVGVLVYCLPFFIAIRNALRIHRGEGLTKYEVFLLGGLVASLVSANTNPYIEALVFQWMFVLPAVYFIERPHNGKFAGNAT